MPLVSERILTEHHIALGQRLRRLRNAKGLSQYRVSKMMKLSIGLIGRIENGTCRRLDLEVVMGMAVVYGVRFWELFKEADSPPCI